MSFSESVIVTDGDYAVTDAEWNYKDTAHINYVHARQTNTIQYSTNERESSSVWVLRIFGMKIPVQMNIYQIDHNGMVAVTALPFFLLITETLWKSLGNNSSRVTTKYRLGSTRIFRPFHGLVHNLLRRNNEALMAEERYDRKLWMS